MCLRSYHHRRLPASLPPRTDLSAALTARGGPFILGAAPSLGDALLFPFAARFAALEHHRSFVVPATPTYAAFHAWVSAMKARPAVAKTLSPDSLFIEAYGAWRRGGRGGGREGVCGL